MIKRSILPIYALEQWRTVTINGVVVFNLHEIEVSAGIEARPAEPDAAIRITTDDKGDIVIALASDQLRSIARAIQDVLPKEAGGQ